MAKPILSIIIVNWNTKKLLLACLNSIFTGTKTENEVIIVDNGSSDGSVNAVTRKYPRVRLIETHKNLGMGTGNNRGLAKAQGQYLLILNTDTLVPPGAFDRMVEFMDKHPKIDILGPELRYPDGKPQISGGNFPNLINVGILFLGIDDLPIVGGLLPLYQRGGMFLPGKQKSPSPLQPTDWLMGACLLMRAKVYRCVGGFDENIFMYGEEVEWAYRAKKAGFSIWLTTQITIIHFKGGSATLGLEGAILGEMKGLLYFFKKHKPRWQIPLLTILLKIGSLGRLVLFSLLRRPDLVRVYRSALRI